MVKTPGSTEHPLHQVAVFSESLLNWRSWSFCFHDILLCHFVELNFVSERCLCQGFKVITEKE